MSATTTPGAASTAFRVVPTNASPNQEINITLANQTCLIRLYTKSIYAPIATPSSSEPPVYQNFNPCFIDLYVAGTLIVGGVYIRQGSLIVRDTYLGFSGDLSVIDTSGEGEDPFGVPVLLPPQEYQTPWQRSIPPSFAGLAPPNYGGTIPGMGTRWLLTYWPVGSYTPGYALPR